jgi:hypothetical protein
MAKGPPLDRYLIDVAMSQRPGGPCRADPVRKLNEGKTFDGCLSGLMP